jgi:hypothetical protein
VRWAGWGIRIGFRMDYRGGDEVEGGRGRIE